MLPKYPVKQKKQSLRYPLDGPQNYENIPKKPPHINLLKIAQNNTKTPQQTPQHSNPNTPKQSGRNFNSTTQILDTQLSNYIKDLELIRKRHQNSLNTQQSSPKNYFSNQNIRIKSNNNKNKKSSIDFIFQKDIDQKILTNQKQQQQQQQQCQQQQNNQYTQQRIIQNNQNFHALASSQPQSQPQQFCKVEKIIQDRKIKNFHINNLDISNQKNKNSLITDYICDKSFIKAKINTSKHIQNLEISNQNTSINLLGDRAQSTPNLLMEISKNQNSLKNQYSQQYQDNMMQQSRKSQNGLNDDTFTIYQIYQNQQKNHDLYMKEDHIIQQQASSNRSHLNKSQYEDIISLQTLYDQEIQKQNKWEQNATVKIKNFNIMESFDKKKKEKNTLKSIYTEKPKTASCPKRGSYRQIFQHINQNSQNNSNNTNNFNNNQKNNNNFQNQSQQKRNFLTNKKGNSENLWIPTRTLEKIQQTFQQGSKPGSKSKTCRTQQMKSKIQQTNVNNSSSNNNNNNGIFQNQQQQQQDIRETQKPLFLQQILKKSREKQNNQQNLVEKQYEKLSLKRQKKSINNLNTLNDYTKGNNNNNPQKLKINIQTFNSKEILSDCSLQNTPMNQQFQHTPINKFSQQRVEFTQKNQTQPDTKALTDPRKIKEFQQSNSKEKYQKSTQFELYNFQNIHIKKNLENYGKQQQQQQQLQQQPTQGVEKEYQDYNNLIAWEKDHDKERNNELSQEIQIYDYQQMI